MTRSAAPLPTPGRRSTGRPTRRSASRGEGVVSSCRVLRRSRIVNPDRGHRERQLLDGFATVRGRPRRRSRTCRAVRPGPFHLEQRQVATGRCAARRTKGIRNALTELATCARVVAGEPALGLEARGAAAIRASLTLSRRSMLTTTVPAGTRTSPIVVSRSACSGCGATGFGASSRARRPRRSSSCASCSIVAVSRIGDAAAHLLSRAPSACGASTAGGWPEPACWRWCPRRQGAWSTRCQRPARRRCCRFRVRRRRRAWPEQVGRVLAQHWVACSRTRASATKRSTAARTLDEAALRARRSAGVRQTRHSGSGARMRRNNAGKILSRCCWMRSPSVSSVFTSAPNAGPAIVSTV